MRRVFIISLVLLAALLTGCTSTPPVSTGDSSTSAPAAADSWAKADLLALAADAGSSAVEVTETTTLDSSDALALLGRAGDVTKAAPLGATEATIKARFAGGSHDGRVVWIVGVYPVEMPLLRGGEPTSSSAPRSAREVNVFDANTGEHLRTLLTPGPPPRD